MSRTRQRVRVFLARHLFLYLAVVIAVAGLATVLIARDDLVQAWRGLDARWLPAILLLSLVNYLCRFAKWQRMLGVVGLRIPLASSARIYFACFSMIVTPFRLGEGYKLLFLKKLHGADFQRSAPVLAMERITDAIAVLALASLWLDPRLPLPLSMPGVLLLAAVGAVAASHDTPRRMVVATLGRLPLVRRKADAIEGALVHNSALLAPACFLPALLWSVLAWCSECLGLWVLLRALGSTLGVIDASWIYAAATAFGNLTFLPGGLGSTEATMAGLLLSADVGRSIALPATILVRAATLWFAVAFGLVVTFVARRSLRWQDVQEDAAAGA